MNLRIGRLPTAALVTLGAAALPVPGVAGWFVADALWDHPVAGAIVPYVVLGVILLADERTSRVALMSVIAFAASLPVVYLLVVALRGLLAGTGLADYAGPGDVLLRHLDWIVAATGLGALLTFIGTLKKAAEPRGPAPGPRPDIEELFLLGLAFRVPLAFVLAGLRDIPPAPLAQAVLGAAFGVTLCAGAVLYTTLVNEEPVREAGLLVMLIGMVLAACGVLAVLEGLTGDRATLMTALRLVPAAIAACGATYLGAWLIAGTAGRLRRPRVEATDGREHG